MTDDTRKQLRQQWNASNPLPPAWDSYDRETQKQFMRKRNEEFGAHLISLGIKPQKKKEQHTNITEAQKLILAKQPDAASELLTKEIIDRNKIYTTRDDNNSEVWMYQEGIYVPNGKTYITEYCREQLGEAFTTYRANQVIAKVSADTYINPKDFFFNDNPAEIPVLNGILNLETKELTPFTPEKIFFNKINAEYDTSADCPSFKKHIETVLGFPEEIKVMQEVFGWCLWKEYTPEKFIVAYGTGRNGKDKTFEVLRILLGLDNCASKSLYDLQYNQWASGELFNKMVNISGENSNAPLKYVEALKALTGRSLISGQRKYMTSIHFVNYAKMIFSCNHIPEISEDSMAIWARIIMLNFPYQFLKQEEIDFAEDSTWMLPKDEGIVKKITTPEELSGVLNWALEGLHRLREQGDFSVSKTTAQVRNEWQRQANSLKAFVFEKCEQTDAITTKTDFKAAYYDYCKLNGVKKLPYGEWPKILKEFGIFPERTDKAKVWEGVKLRND